MVYATKIELDETLSKEAAEELIASFREITEEILELRYRRATGQIVGQVESEEEIEEDTISAWVDEHAEALSSFEFTARSEDPYGSYRINL